MKKLFFYAIVIITIASLSELVAVGVFLSVCYTITALVISKNS